MRQHFRGELLLMLASAAAGFLVHFLVFGKAEWTSVFVGLVIGFTAFALLWLFTWLRFLLTASRALRHRELYIKQGRPIPGMPPGTILTLEIPVRLRGAETALALDAMHLAREIRDFASRRARVGSQNQAVREHHRKV